MAGPRSAAPSTRASTRALPTATWGDGGRPLAFGRRAVTVLVGIETLLLVLLVLLVIGLLRSHAEILRRLDEIVDDAPPTAAHHQPAAVPPPPHADAVDIGGQTLAG